jgi:peptide/nickel transport system ATP-binding protein
MKITELSVTFHTRSGEVRALRRASLEQNTGETLALTGETGCGKSVLAHAVLGLLPENASVSGSIIFNGRNLLTADEKTLESLRGSEISIILQNPGAALNPIMKIGRQIAEPLKLHSKLRYRESLPVLHRILARLGFTELDRHLNFYPHQFSGGMKQRVLIAAGTISQPKLIIADEPTKGLDDSLRRDLIQEFLLIKKEFGTSMLLISHDFTFAESLADRIAVMYAGEIVETASMHDFFTEQKHPYCRALIQSLPRNGFHPIPGPPVSLSSLPDGCSFHPRCRNRMLKCMTVQPPLIRRGGRTVQCHLYA